MEERILDLQEKKRELANQTIEGGKGGAGKLGMKEILQLFRRDAEHAPPTDMTTYDLGAKPRILKDISTAGGASASTSVASNSRASSAPRERKVTPPVRIQEDAIYGRRW